MRLQLKWPSQLVFHILLCIIAALFGASNPRMANASFLAKRILVTVRWRARCYVFPVIGGVKINAQGFRAVQTPRRCWLKFYHF